MRPATLAALIGAALGVACATLWGGSLGLTVPAGAFVGWWLWLFARASRSDPRIPWLAVPGFAALAVLIFTLERGNLQAAERFRQDGVTTQAAVTGIFAEQHNQIGYRYTVGGTLYDGRDTAPGLARNFKPGDTIAVQYLKSDPRVSAARHPSETTRSVVGFSLLGAAWLVSGFVIMQVYVRPAMRRSIGSLWRRKA